MDDTLIRIAIGSAAFLFGLGLGLTLASVRGTPLMADSVRTAMRREQNQRLNGRWL